MREQLLVNLAITYSQMANALYAKVWNMPVGYHRVKAKNKADNYALKAYAFKSNAYRLHINNM